MLRASVWLLVASVVLIVGMIAATEWVHPVCDDLCRARRAKQWDWVSR